VGLWHGLPIDVQYGLVRVGLLPSLCILWRSLAHGKFLNDDLNIIFIEFSTFPCGTVMYFYF
jgi:hypothetical protein